jgi:hypothetical protein
MNGTGLFTVLAVFLMVAAAIYRIQSLHQKKIWNLSIQQLIHLVLIPGIIFPMIFSYLQTVVKLPRSSTAVISDGFLVNSILLSMMFSYGGIAIHAVTKMLQDYLDKSVSEARRVNAFFHTTFSHNMAFVGIVLASFGLTLLEINHVPEGNTASFGSGIVRGLLLGGSFGLAVWNYTRYTGGDYGRWSDLKITFGAIWLVFAFLIYIVDKMEIGFSEYDLLLPILLSFSLMVGLSLVLVVRRLKRGGIRIMLKKND